MTLKADKIVRTIHATLGIITQTPVPVLCIVSQVPVAFSSIY
jgi:hypothetical protein